MGPATNANAVDDTVFAVPEDAPPATVVMVVRTVPPPLGVGPMIVIDGFVDSWLRVMFGPATKAKADDDAVFAVPAVAPPAVAAIDTRVE